MYANILNTVPVYCTLYSNDIIHILCSDSSLPYLIHSDIWMKVRGGGGGQQIFQRLGGEGGGGVLCANRNQVT